jgi:hypothetical protein
MPGNENDIPPRSYLVPLNPRPYRFSHPAFDLVPIHSVANPPPDDKAKTAMVQAIPQRRDHQQWMDPGVSLTSDTLKVGICSQTMLSAHSTSGPCLLALGQELTPLHRQLVAPLAPPGLENGPPAFGFHSRPKSVHSLSAAHLGLPRSLRHSCTSSIRFTARNYTPFSPSLQIRVRWRVTKSLFTPGEKDTPGSGVQGAMQAG